MTQDKRASPEPGPLAARFITHFGEMGSRWGINRTVGQIYALLYISPRPLNADEIAAALSFSRSNVSMGLKELDGWRLLRRSYLAGDRREYLRAPDDVWEIFRTLVEERRRREVEPTLSMLRDALLAAPASDSDAYAQKRMREMHDLIDMSTDWFDEVQKLDRDTLARLMKMGAQVQKVLSFARGRRKTEPAG
jgi:DNA-binding transcriptional regulator GbsR (MarR family)